MSWRFLYDWNGLNVALFQAINGATPPALDPVAIVFTLIGSYWTAPLMVLGLWSWRKQERDPLPASILHPVLLRFCLAFFLALVSATFLKLWLDFPRPITQLGDAVRLIGTGEHRYSFPSGHATYSALVVGALWSLLPRAGRIGLIVYATLVGWSRIAAGMHFPADVLAGWGFGAMCTVLAAYMVRFLKQRAQRGAPHWTWLTIAAGLVLSDQLTKFAITQLFVYGERVDVTPFFNFVYVLNPGAAFSFLANAGGWQRYFFTVLGLAVSAWLIRLLWQSRSSLSSAGYSLVLGGALGNVADRLLRHKVVDFLDFHWQLSHWPAFNLADVAITSGVALLIAHSMTESDPQPTPTSRKRMFRLPGFSGRSND